MTGIRSCKGPTIRLAAVVMTCRGHAAGTMTPPRRTYRPATDVASPVNRGLGAPGGAGHSLRHTFGTWLAEDGATATEIQRQLGHASLNTSQGYIDATAAEQRAAARANRTYRALERITAGS